MRVAIALLFAATLHAAELKLPATVVRLDNGLTLVMQQDLSMPHAGVELWIRGGSRDEAPGQYGIAHLFEHNLPSSGRFYGNAENRARRAATAREGGAGTQPDFLRFYNTVTPDGLEVAIGYLADRMESDPTKFTEENVKRDQDIVVSELRRSFNIDWDLDVMNQLARGTFGADHPYGHAVSGSESDVRNATVETMREWHRRFAGAANAYVFVVGNFEPAQAEAMVRRHFGSIAPGTRLTRTRDAVPPARARHDVIEEDVSKPLFYLRWPVAAWGTEDADLLRLFARVVGAEVEFWELAGAFTLRGEDRTAMMRKLERALRDGITKDELTAAKRSITTEILRAAERPVWRNSRADLLGFGLMYRDDVNHYQKSLARMSSATPEQVVAAAKRWLSMPGYVLEVVPRVTRTAGAPTDRAATVAPAEAKPVQFPEVRRAKIDGIDAIIVSRDALPLTQLTFVYDQSFDVEALAKVIPDATTERDRDFATLSIATVSENAPNIIAAVKNAKLTPSKNDGALTPMQQRDRALECAIGGDCEPAPRTIANKPLLILASGDLNSVPNVGPASAGPSGVRLKPDLHLSSEQFLIVDHPSATQAHILLGIVLPNETAKDPLLAQIVAGALRSRLMDNLRSAKGWSYEIYPYGVELRRGGAVMRFNMPVQLDKAAESITEVRNEIKRLREEPLTEQTARAMRGNVETVLTSGLMSLERMNTQLLELARNDLPSDTFSRTLARLQTITPADVTSAARALLLQEKMIWVIAAPRAAIESELRELGVTAK